MEYPRSPLSKEAPIDEDFALSTGGDSSDAASSLETLSKPAGENAATSKTGAASPPNDSTSKESEAGWENVDLTSKANTPLSEVPPNEPKSSNAETEETASEMRPGA